MVNEHLSALSLTAEASGHGDNISLGVPPAAFVARRVVVDVPATCANLGPGFDCLALAVHLHNRFEVILHADLKGASGRPQLEIRGDTADIQQLRCDQDNLFLRSFRAVCQRLDIATPPLSARLDVRVPPGRGLGSSATAVVGGILAANTLLGAPLGQHELLELAITCEPGHHADNVAAALLGRLTVTGARDAAGQLVSLALPVPPALRAVLFIPNLSMSTTHSRSLLPATYSCGDATYNTSRVALLLAALQAQRFDLLGTAMEDRFHQPYREQLFPVLGALIDAGCQAGAHGVCLSGSGSSVLALVTQGAEAVCAAMEATASRLGVAGRGLVLDLAREGAIARVSECEDAAVAELELEEGGSGGE
jgi:homoserine kinase